MRTLFEGFLFVLEDIVSYGDDKFDLSIHITNNLIVTCSAVPAE